jgi:hypothetical protein
MAPFGLSQVEKDEMYKRRKAAGRPRLLADGDSWFSYPIHSNLIDWIVGRSSYAVKRCERSGDTLETIVGTGRYVRWLDTEKPLCLLLSGGGDDLAREPWVQRMFRAPDGSGDPRQMLVANVWQEQLDQFESQFERLVSSVGGTPVLAHGYDFFTPSTKAVRVLGFPLTGPWIHPFMVSAGIDQAADQAAVARVVVNDFNDLLARLAARHPNFHHADLRGNITAQDWVNEIHPNSQGFRWLADAYSSCLRNVLGGIT